MYPWFNVFPEYYNQEFEKFKKAKPDIDAMKIHEECQTENPAQSAIEWDVATQGPIPVYADYEVVLEALTDKRFMFVDHPKKAKILWLTTDYE